MFHITPENRIAIESILLIALSVAAFFVARPVRQAPAQSTRKAA